MWNIRAAARLGGLWNSAAKRLLEADAILDISGGDSFTDLYGEHRFQAVAYTKQIALEHRVPLVLLPQTYGPFTSRRAHEEASRIIRHSAMAVARDQHSFEILRELAGTEFDASRYLAGVDVAFLLDPRAPQDPVPDSAATWLSGDRSAPVVGFNVSGLIYNDPHMAQTRYGLRADYREAVRAFLGRLLAHTDARVLLVPHVVTAPTHYESDTHASQCALDSLDRGVRDRVCVIPGIQDPGEAKWLIAQTDWFCGTRMHATIAGLSSGVPTASISYSDKTLGVFETCGQGAHAHDPRRMGTEELVDRVWWSFEQRRAAAESLAAHLPAVMDQANRQFDQITDCVLRCQHVPCEAASA